VFLIDSRRSHLAINLQSARTALMHRGLPTSVLFVLAVFNIPLCKESFISWLTAHFLGLLSAGGGIRLSLLIEHFAETFLLSLWRWEMMLE
jgi:hypothetical protein